MHLLLKILYYVSCTQKRMNLLKVFSIINYDDEFIR